MLQDTLTILKKEFKKGANQYPNIECYFSEISFNDLKGNSVEDLSKRLEEILISSEEIPFMPEAPVIITRWQDKIYKGKYVRHDKHTMKFVPHKGSKAWGQHIFFWILTGYDNYLEAKKALDRFRTLARIAIRQVLPAFGKNFPLSEDLCTPCGYISQWLLAVRYLSLADHFLCFDIQKDIRLSLDFSVIKDLFLESTIACNRLLDKLAKTESKTKAGKRTKAKTRGRPRKYADEQLSQMSKAYETQYEILKDSKAAWNKVAEIFEAKSGDAVRIACTEYQKKKKLK